MRIHRNISLISMLIIHKQNGSGLTKAELCKRCAISSFLLTFILYVLVLISDHHQQRKFDFVVHACICDPSDLHTGQAQ